MALSTSSYFSSGETYHLKEKIRQAESKIESLESKVDLLIRMLERHFPSENIVKELEQEVKK